MPEKAVNGIAEIVCESIKSSNSKIFTELLFEYINEIINRLKFDNNSDK